MFGRGDGNDHEILDSSAIYMALPTWRTSATPVRRSTSAAILKEELAERFLHKVVSSTANMHATSAAQHALDGRASFPAQRASRNLIPGTS